MIRNLIFDFGKVLIDYDFSLSANRFFQNPDEGKKFFQIFSEPKFIEKCDLEFEPFDQIIEEAKKEYPQYAEVLQLFILHYADFVTGEIPGMKDLLTRLKSEGFKLYGLTNWCSKIREIMNLYDIFRLLDDSIISAEEHLIKPDPAIYLRLCEKFHLDPSECLFTDDKPENIEGAKKAGMQGIVFVDAKQYEKELKRHSLISPMR